MVGYWLASRDSRNTTPHHTHTHTHTHYTQEQDECRCLQVGHLPHRQHGGLLYIYILTYTHTPTHTMLIYHWIKGRKKNNIRLFSTNGKYRHLCLILQICAGAFVTNLSDPASAWRQCPAGGGGGQWAAVPHPPRHGHGGLLHLPAGDLKELRQDGMEGGHQGNYHFNSAFNMHIQSKLL